MENIADKRERNIQQLFALKKSHLIDTVRTLLFRTFILLFSFRE